MSRQLFLHELLHAFSSQKQLQSFYFLSANDFFTHDFFIILIAPETFLLVSDVIELNANISTVSFI